MQRVSSRLSYHDAAPVLSVARLRKFLSHTSFQAHRKQLLRLHGELHRQLVEHLPGIAVHDESHSLLRIQPPLVTVEKLVVAYLGRCGLVLHHGT